MKDAFSDFHPLVNFIWFLIILLFTMFLMHPVCLLISLICSLVYALFLKGMNGMRGTLCLVLPVFILAAVINPAFNHRGVTELFYLQNGNAVTLEAVIYGLAAAVMLAAVIQWFVCFNVEMTSDKFIYIFGKIIPALSLILSMTLRFIPKFTAQLKVVRNAQRCVGCDVSEGKKGQKLKNALKILSVMITWSLESAIETADSMKSRGYGMKGRTTFSIFRFEGRDGICLGVIFFLTAYVLVGYGLKCIYWVYYPALGEIKRDFYSVTVYIAYAILFFLPVLIDGKEAAKWKKLLSGI